MRFSERLKYVRRELRLTQDDLAQACNVKLTAISKYENEIIKPGFEMLSKMGLAYNINLNWLINEIGCMFIETSNRKLIKNGTNEFSVEVNDEPETIFFEENSHSLDLTTDLKVQYYGINDETYTKIYHKDGKVECQTNTTANNMKMVLEKIQQVCKNKNQFEFLMTAINALNDDNSLAELKMMIKGMEISKK